MRVRSNEVTNHIPAKRIALTIFRLELVRASPCYGSKAKKQRCRALFAAIAPVTDETLVAARRYIGSGESVSPFGQTLPWRSGWLTSDAEG